MRAIVEALEDGVVDDEVTVTRYLQTLREEVDHLAALVDDLFELSRTQAGALRLQFERVSLGDLVSDVLAGSAPVAAAKNVRLEGRLVGPPPELDVSAPEVLRALRNLLENAIRHTPSDGSVVVEAGVDDDDSRVRVRRRARHGRWCTRRGPPSHLRRRLPRRPRALAGKRCGRGLGAGDREGIRRSPSWRRECPQQ